MRIIQSKINISEIWENREIQNTDLLKIVIDVNRRIIAADAEMHADLEEVLIENGSDQKDLWGANLFPKRKGAEFIEYTSFINIRPAQDNKSMEVQNNQIRDSIKKIINELIEK